MKEPIAQGPVDVNVSRRAVMKERFYPLPNSAYWFVSDEWSEWALYFIWWPQRIAGKWRWLETYERRTCIFATEYRQPANANVTSLAPGKDDQ